MSKVFTKITEIYDLHTQVGKMGLIGIKTPTGTCITNQYRGLLANYKNIRFLSCDVKLACASVLPVDPLQIGMEAGQQIDPRDLFEPMLFKAVSNDSMTRLLAKMYKPPLSSADPFNGDSVQYYDDISHDGTSETEYDAFALYHSLLATEKFRKAMPQAGLQMNGLTPYVWPLNTSVRLNSFADSVNAGQNGFNTPGLDGNPQGFREFYSVSGKPRRMPSIPTTPFLRLNNNAPADANYPGKIPVLGIQSTVAKNEFNGTSEVNYYPAVYVGAIITPPARSQILYYRMTVTWNIVFSGLRPLTDIGSYSYIEGVGENLYHTDYTEQAQAMALRGDSIDTNGMPIEPVSTVIS